MLEKVEGESSSVAKIGRRNGEKKEVKADTVYNIMEGIDVGVLESGVMRKGWRNEGRRCRREMV